MSWRQRWKRRLLKKALVNPGCPQWLPEPTLIDTDALIVTVAVSRELLCPENLGVVDRMVGEAASRSAIQATRKRCRESRD